MQTAHEYVLAGYTSILFCTGAGAFCHSSDPVSSHFIKHYDLSTPVMTNTTHHVAPLRLDTAAFIESTWALI